MDASLTLGVSLSQYSCAFDGCVPLMLGSDPVWPSHSGHLGGPRSHKAHKLPENEGHFSSIEWLLSTAQGPHRQHYGGLLHQPSRQYSFLTSVEVLLSGISSLRHGLIELRFRTEWGQLLSYVLSTKVMEIILNARAPSIRTLYAVNWRFFPVLWLGLFPLWIFMLQWVGPVCTLSSV